MPDHRSGGPIHARFEATPDGIALQFEDASAGGGMVLYFPNAAWAQTWLDGLAQQLVDIEHDRVFGR